MASEVEDFLASLDVPEFGSVVHGSCGDEESVGVERQADDFHFVSLEGVVSLASVGVPDFGGAVEGASDDFVAVRVVEGHGVNHILMFLQREQF